MSLLEKKTITYLLSKLKVREELTAHEDVDI